MSDAKTQIGWGFDYIKGAYGVPTEALRQDLTNYKGFPYQGHVGAPYGYDLGGVVPPGERLIYNGTRGNEIMAPEQNFKDYIAGLSGGSSGPASFEGDLYLAPVSSSASYAARRQRS
jgi:hypothetical protein